MALPKIDVPTHKTKIPSTNQVISIRPFLVKEQKILLTALTGEDSEEITDATKQIVNNCVLTPNFDVDKLELFDLEYLILQLRIISVGETTTIRFFPRKNTECEECTKNRDVEINLKNAKINLDSLPDKKVQLTEKIGILLKYPTAKHISKIESAKNSDSLNSLFEVVWMCVEAVYDDDNIISASDVTLAEGIEFLESLNTEQFLKIEKFIKSIPKLEQKIQVKCNSCNFEEDYVISGIENFFG
jgi:hypothetical protein